MRVVVTGAAGFVGSHLCTRLLDEGDEVIGIDCFTDYYSPRRKEANLATLLDRDGFTLQRVDLLSAPLAHLLEDVDVVYHLAGQPGGRASWGRAFEPYVQRNVLATQRLLEAAREASLWKLVYASSSAVYGNAATGPTHEGVRPEPVSPYGVTKLAAEQLCELYRVTSDVPTVSLRLFTVYGPRQRPDMALFRLMNAALGGEPFLLYGDGEQSREFTYVDDVVTAMRKAALSPWTGVADIGGGSRMTMNQVIDAVSALSRPIDVVRLQALRGDVRHAAADTSPARHGFGYEPSVGLEEGLARMMDAAGYVYALDDL